MSNTTRSYLYYYERTGLPTPLASGEATGGEEGRGPRGATAEPGREEGEREGVFHHKGGGPETVVVSYLWLTTL
jgi:hypothetical protein